MAWSEDEEFSGESVDRAQWKSDWRKRGAIEEQRVYKRWKSEHEVPARASATRQKRMRTNFVEPVDRQLIYARDGGICQICGQPVPFDDLAIDHIVAVAVGGTHEPRNVQATHRRCNLKRGVGRRSYVQTRLF